MVVLRPLWVSGILESHTGPRVLFRVYSTFGRAFIVATGPSVSHSTCLQFVILTRIPDPAQEFADCFFVLYCG